MTPPWKKPSHSSSVAGGLDFLICEPAEVYHRQARHCLSSHQLADFRKSPLLYHHKKLGLVRDDDRPAYQVGRATHTLILEGREQFDKEYAVGGPRNPRTGNVYGANTKAFFKWVQQQRKPVLTEAQYELIVRMNEGVRSHERAMDLLSDGLPERVVRTPYRGVDCQIRMDWFDPIRGLVDLKTCDDLTWFEADARRYGYVHQLAFYRAVLAEVLGQPEPVHLIAVEKKEPFRAGVWQVSPELLRLAQRDNETAIENLKQCEASSNWPTGYEELRIFDSL